MKRKWMTATILGCLIYAGSAISEEAANDVLVDKGACPFECCTYRTWYVEKETGLVEKPEVHAKIIASVQPGAKVEAITGEVHATAGVFEVEKEFSGYKPGDILRVFTYLGEGRFKTLFDGQMHDEDLDCSPYGAAEYTSGLGTFKTKPDSVWWILMKTQNGEIGWTNLPDNFSNKDACN